MLSKSLISGEQKSTESALEAPVFILDFEVEHLCLVLGGSLALFFQLFVSQHLLADPRNLHLVYQDVYSRGGAISTEN